MMLSPSTWLPSLPLVLYLLAITSVGAASSGGQIDRLAWMAGSWASEGAGARIEEHWMAPAGGSMVGMHRDVTNGKAVSFEFIRIESDSTGLVYLASPRGRPATPFRLKELEAERVVFENATHDFPQRVLYWLDRERRLHARIEGTLNGKVESEDWVWSRDHLDPR